MKKVIVLIALLIPITVFGQDTLLNQQNDSKKIKDKETVFKNVEKPTKFKGNINTYLSRNIEYPDIARRMNVEGVVTINFVVDEEGNVVDARVKKGIGLGCDEEALRVVKGMPKFEPAMQNGKNVKMYYTLNVRFKLQDHHADPFDEHKLKFPNENFH